jgi:hypothetical protein
MAPFYEHVPRSRNFNLKAPSAAFEAVWVSPSNYAFTILLLLGGDVVSRALAQLAGGYITPVAFSFGMFFCLLVLQPCSLLCENGLIEKQLLWL